MWYVKDLCKGILLDAAQEGFGISDVRFLHLVSAYATRVGLVEEIDRLLDCDMEVSPGWAVLAMVLDAFSGPKPLFRLQEFFADKDIELLLGEDIPLSKLGDHTLRRVLTRLFDAGTNTVLGAIALREARSFPWTCLTPITTLPAMRREGPIRFPMKVLPAPPRTGPRCLARAQREDDPKTSS